MYPYKNLLKIAFIASPIMGLSGILPMYFVHSRNDESVPTILMRLSVITLLILVLWLINIGILKLLENTSKKYLRTIVSVIVTSLFLLIPALTITPPSLPMQSMGGFPIMPTSAKIFLPLFSGISNNLVILFIIELIISKTRERIILNENSELKIKNLEAQQLQLKQQIHPHFLFNSLNTLKSLISDYPIQAEEYLVKLSSFLRYNLSSNDLDLIPLKDELKICFDYLEIQKVRFKEGLIYSIDIEDEVIKNAKLPTFAIQLLIENAIKHNVLTAKNPLIIGISITDKLEIRVRNNLQEKGSTENSMQIGLKNLSERYKLLIKKDIKINKTANEFEVLLPINP